MDTGDPSAIPAGSIEVLGQFTDPGPSGIAVTPDKRLFISFPRHAQNHKDATLAEIIDGKRVPFPNNQMSLPSDLPLKDRLISVHGIALDSQNNLWVIDDGKRVGIKGIPDGAAKVVGFDIHTHKIIASLPIHAPTLLQDSHLNDLRIDLTHGEKGTLILQILLLTRLRLSLSLILLQENNAECLPIMYRPNLKKDLLLT